MIKKVTRIAIALVLTLGLILSSASVVYATGKPVISVEVNNVYIEGTQLHYYLHLVNLAKAAFYENNITHNDDTANSIGTGNYYALPRLSRDYISEEIIRNIAAFGSVSGHYDVQVNLYDKKMNLIRAATGTVYTVTFNEINDRSGVAIQVYSDSGLTVPVGSALTTDTSGEATIGLSNGTYYYKATKTFYADHTDDFTVSGAPLTESFTMALPAYTVTLNETNDVAGVSIQVYSDSFFTVPVGSALTTDANGEATIDLQDGVYYYKATKTGYADLKGDFFVDGGPLFENFTLIPAYTVTFDETNDVADVSIQVYKNAARTVTVGSAVTTNASGRATIDLPNGIYYYKATKISYKNLLGNFTVSSSPLTESFTMIPIYTVTFNETNDVAGVDLYVWDNPDHTGAYIDLVVTNASGEATIDLPDGTYYYVAIKTGYLYFYGDFTVSGAPLTESFTMIAVYTVTFNETNGLSGVYIEIYNDEDYVGDVATNGTGQATIDLPIDSYYYYADKSGYYEYEGDFTVSDSDITESFTMSSAPVYTVTFNETNGLSGVYIEIYNGEYYVGDVTTNGTGQATIDLPNDSYYYYADKSGYYEYEGDFTVSDSAITESFAMSLAPAYYAVTFNETNDLEGVNIEVYSDPDRIEWEGSLTTNATGQATIDLENGTYYYTATLFLYADLFGNFTVSSAGVPVDFEMVPLTGVIFAEDFTGVDVWTLPAGWTTNESDIFVDNSNSAGGVVPELYLKYGPDSMAYYDYRVSTPAINATAATSTLNLCFKHFLHLYDYDLPYTYAVEVSTNGGTNWTATSFVASPTETIGPTTVNIDLSAYVGQIINISWRLYGYTWHSDGWYIDDIIVTGS